MEAPIHARVTSVTDLGVDILIGLFDRELTVTVPTYTEALALIFDVNQGVRKMLDGLLQEQALVVEKFCEALYKRGVAPDLIASATAEIGDKK